MCFFLKAVSRRSKQKLMLSDGKKASGGLNDIDFLLESKVLINTQANGSDSYNFSSPLDIIRVG